MFKPGDEIQYNRPMGSTHDSNRRFVIKEERSGLKYVSIRPDGSHEIFRDMDISDYVLVTQTTESAGLQRLKMNVKDYHNLNRTNNLAPVGVAKFEYMTSLLETFGYRYEEIPPAPQPPVMGFVKVTG